MKLEKIQRFILEECKKKSDGVVSHEEIYLARYGTDAEISLKQNIIRIDCLKKERSCFNRCSHESKETTQKIKALWIEIKKAKAKIRRRHLIISLAFNQLLIRGLVWAKSHDEWMDIQDYLGMARAWGNHAEVIDLRKNKWGLTHRDYEIYNRDLIVAGGDIHLSLYPKQVKINS